MDDPTPVGAHQPRNHAKDRGLARPRRPDEGRRLPVHRKGHVEVEAVQAVMELDLQARSHTGSSSDRRLRTSTRTPTNSPALTTTSSAEMASAPSRFPPEN